MVLVGKVRLGRRLVRIVITEAGEAVEPGLYLVELYLPTTKATKASLREALKYGDFDRAVEKATHRGELVRARVKARIYNRDNSYMLILPASTIIDLARSVELRSAIVYVRLIERIAPLVGQ